LKTKQNKIPVTKSFIPPLEEYSKTVGRAFDKEWLTNRGHLVEELESKISSLLALENTNLICMNNGTTPLQIALKILGNEGEVITTPFSYVATTAAIVWENCKPVFVDIHPEYLTIDETKIEAAITTKTTCILATHVFGNPCNIEEIERIAKKHKLKVIYDAAHCFGVKYNGKSIFEYGDISTCSFHATKIFHTGEGGAIFCSDKELYKKVYYSHNFGHNGEYEYHGLGINGKMSELNAAMGLSVLPYFKEIVSKRKILVNYYYDLIDKNVVNTIKIRESTLWNFSYFPVLFKSENALINAIDSLNTFNIYPRRYFKPSLENLPYLSSSYCQVSSFTSKVILCLPLFFELSKSEIKKITNHINEI
jgi:dTDP-4-amino-4,6-dideoxygalactose transaminase